MKKIEAEKEIITIDVIKSIYVPIKTGTGRTKTGFNREHEIQKAQEEINEPNIMNKKEFIYANYYERIRAAVHPKWVKAIRASMVKLIGKTFITSILVISDSVGRVLETILVASCGNPDIDAIAMNSMKNEFFPNPPKGIIDADGYIRIVWTYNITP